MPTNLLFYMSTNKFIKKYDNKPNQKIRIILAL